MQQKARSDIELDKFIRAKYEDSSTWYALHTIPSHNNKLLPEFCTACECVPYGAFQEFGEMTAYNFQ